MKAYSYFELLISIIIIATLSALSLKHYGVQKERALDSQAQTSLVSIIAAERDFRRQGGSFSISANEATLNADLAGVILPTANMEWDYFTTQNAANTICCAQAERMPLPGRTWRLCTSETEPVAGTCGMAAGNCP
jgi:type II secretory pathway pseudopilin PulG